MKILTAEEINGTIHASVQFEDGNQQTVILPAWATQQNIKDEATRLRAQSDASQANKIDRTDLVDA